MNDPRLKILEAMEQHFGKAFQQADDETEDDPTTDYARGRMSAFNEAMMLCNTLKAFVNSEVGQ